MSEDSLYARFADKVNLISKKCMRDIRYLLTTIFVVAAILFSTVYFTQEACAEGIYSSSQECIEEVSISAASIAFPVVSALPSQRTNQV